MPECGVWLVCHLAELSICRNSAKMKWFFWTNARMGDESLNQSPIARLCSLILTIQYLIKPSLRNGISLQYFSLGFYLRWPSIVLIWDLLLRAMKQMLSWPAFHFWRALQVELCSTGLIKIWSKHLISRDCKVIRVVFSRNLNLTMWVPISCVGLLFKFVGQDSYIVYKLHSLAIGDCFSDSLPILAFFLQKSHHFGWILAYR